MGSENHPVRQSGIYHNLPQFDPDIKGLTAIVTGANGISGFHTCRALLDSPQRWSKIYAMSRRPPPEGMMNLLTPEQRGKIEHVASDFLKEPEELAEAMKKAGIGKVDYVFFYSYLQPKPPPDSPPWSNAEELVKVNSALLRNFLNALPLVNLKPKRILLQTGAKNYGVHLGRGRTPCLESDPQPSHLEPNFYYPQEELLFKYCKEHEETEWNIIMPAWIIGATVSPFRTEYEAGTMVELVSVLPLCLILRDHPCQAGWSASSAKLAANNAQMNALHPFAIYAAVCAQQSAPLAFPGDWDSWQGDAHHSSARLTGYLSEWAILEPKCANHRFNSQDTSPVSWDRYFERLVQWFGVTQGITPPPDTDEKMFRIEGKSGKQTPMGYGPPVVSKASWTLTQWAKRNENREAWREIMRESGGKVTHDPFEDVEANFTFGDGAFIRVGCLGMNKARRMGWTGFVDTVEAVHEMYWEMGGNGEGGLGMLPAMKVKDTLPLI